MQFRLPSSGFRVLVLAVLALGILVRFVNLDQKPYWHDETYTSLRISGYRAEEAVARLFNNQLLSVDDALIYQRRNSHKTLVDVIQSLAHEDPHHPPLFFSLEWFWTGMLGSSVWTIRLLPAVLSLLQFPVLFWLCLELFGSAMVGWVAIALFAVSPLYVRYAQEARQYSLWITLIFLSMITLMQAVRHQRLQNWAFYALVTIAGLYCHIFHGFVLIGQGLYVLVLAGRWNGLLKGFLGAVSMSLAAFSPWIWVILTHWQRLLVTTNWATQALPLAALLKIWSLHLCHIFLSWNPIYDDGWVYWVIPILGLLGCAIYTLVKRTAPSVWLMLLMLMGVPVVVLALPDLLQGGQRSVSDRYFFPTYIGLSLVIFYLLGSLNSAEPALRLRSAALGLRFPVHQVGQFLTLLLILCGILSCGWNAQAATWWRWSEFDVEVASLINRSPQPLMISDMPLGEVMALVHRFKPTVQLLLVNNPETLILPILPQPTQPDIFVYNPSVQLRTQLERHYALKPLYQFRENLLVIALYQVSQTGVVYTDK
jgi:uncharacterized membrane protein